MRTFDGVDRRGVALITAMMALAVIGVLVASAHLAGVRAHRAGERRFLRSESLAAAEYGVERAAANAPIGLWRSMAPGAVDSAGPWPVGRGTASVRITRLGDSISPLVQIVGTGTVGPGPGRSARRSTSLTLALTGGTFAPPGALTTTGALTLGTGSVIEGADLSPAGWSCPIPGVALPGVVTSDASTVSAASCGLTCIGGAPPISQSTIASDTLTYFTFGELGWSDLARTGRPISGTMTPGPSVGAGGTCLTSDPANWGDPDRSAPPGACESHFPVLHASGDFHLAGGVGQGVLLVDGNLTMSGGARFVGLIIARGTVNTQAGGGQIEGALMAASLFGAPNSLAGPISVIYSRCALNAAQRASERVIPIPFIAWGEVY